MWEYWFETFTPAQLQTTTYGEHINELAEDGYRLTHVTRLNDEEVLLTFEREKKG